MQLVTHSNLSAKIRHANELVLIVERLGGQAVSLEVNQPGFESAGYVDISTSDSVVHGQVKQSGAFSFVRIYDAGRKRCS